MGALDMGLAPGVLPGRVALEDGRAWFEAAWGSVPAARGRGSADILAAAAGDQAEGDRIRALVLLGADPLTDFPDRRLAGRALDGAAFVVAVASAPGAALDHADVVLPAAEAHERPGTTTNIEGRIFRVGQKLVPPGQAWPDWMIAAELAVHLGSDLGFDSVGAVWDEIEQVAASHRGITQAVLDSDGAADGIVAPLGSSPVSLAGAARSTRSPCPVWSRSSARARQLGRGWPGRPVRRSPAPTPTPPCPRTGTAPHVLPRCPVRSISSCHTWLRRTATRSA